MATAVIFSGGFKSASSSVVRAAGKILQPAASTAAQRTVLPAGAIKNAVAAVKTIDTDLAKQFDALMRLQGTQKNSLSLFTKPIDGVRYNILCTNPHNIPEVRNDFIFSRQSWKPREWTDGIFPNGEWVNEFSTGLKNIKGEYAIVPDIAGAPQTHSVNSQLKEAFNGLSEWFSGALSRMPFNMFA
jgi:hypothetical protein